MRGDQSSTESPFENRADSSLICGTFGLKRLRSKVFPPLQLGLQPTDLARHVVSPGATQLLFLCSAVVGYMFACFDISLLLVLSEGHPKAEFSADQPTSGAACPRQLYTRPLDS